MKTVSQKGAIRSTNGHSALRDKQHVQIKPGVAPRVKTLAAHRNRQWQDAEYDIGIDTRVHSYPSQHDLLIPRRRKKENNEHPHQKQGYSIEANECFMGAPVEEQKQMAQSKLSRRLGVTRDAKAPKKSKLLGLKPVLL